MNVSSRLACCLLAVFCCALASCQQNPLPAAPPDIVQQATAVDPPPASEEAPPPAAADSAVAAETEVKSSAGEVGKAQASAGKPLEIPLPDATGIRECSFDNLKFEMIKGDPFFRNMLTPQIEQLVGQRIRIRGYILPSFQQKGLTDFVLVRDNMECCFGPGAALYDCVLVSMQPGKSTSFSIRPVAVEGTFTVDEFIGPDGKHLAIYRLEGETVK